MVDAHLDAIVEIETMIHRNLYKKTGNGAHAWAAYFQIRRLKLKRLPDWLLEYFDSAAGAVIAAKGTSSAKAIVSVLGLATRGGGLTARDRAARAKQREVIKQRVKFYRSSKEPKLTIEDALAKVADELPLVAGKPLSLERLRAIYYE